MLFQGVAFSLAPQFHWPCRKRLDIQLTYCLSNLDRRLLICIPFRFFFVAIIFIEDDLGIEISGSIGNLQLEATDRLIEGWRCQLRFALLLDYQPGVKLLPNVSSYALARDINVSMQVSYPQRQLSCSSAHIT
jgi:hypothetical protein